MADNRGFKAIMLLRFHFSNFRSFKEEQEFTLVAEMFGDSPEIVRHPPAIKEGLLPLAAIYGANASGKTNVIRALQFMSEAVKSSYRLWEPDGPIPRDPFLGDEESARAPSEFVVDLLLNDVRHQYGFRLDSERVLEEWLHVYPKGKKQTWFHRKSSEPTTFSNNMPGENRTIENLTRKNCLFLSAAAQNNHDALLPIFTWLTRSLKFVLGERGVFLELTAECCRFPEYRSRVKTLVSVADLGISDLQVRDAKVSDLNAGFSKLVAAAYYPSPPPATADSIPEIALLHQLGGRTLPFRADQESAGTLGYLALLGPAVSALNNGRVLCIDELDASLHPLLAAQLMRLFNNPVSNPNGAQLILTTHDTNLLSGGILRRDQIWFTEKNHDASSHLYPLTDFKPRRDENLQNGYLQGRYGAIPFLNPDSFLLQFKGSDGKA
jgi:hypothetical protein